MSLAVWALMGGGGQDRVILDLLRNDTVYVQFLSYANSHVWADLHAGAVRSRQ